MRGWGSGEGGKWRMIFFGFCSLLGHFLEWMLIGWHIKSENMRKKGECTQMCQNYLLKKGKRECHPNQLFFQSANPSIHFAHPKISLCNLDYKMGQKNMDIWGLVANFVASGQIKIHPIIFALSFLHCAMILAFWCPQFVPHSLTEDQKQCQICDKLGRRNIRMWAFWGR